MSTAAVGGLSAEQEGELRAHVSRCGTCDKQLLEERALVAAMERSLAARLGGEPSPSFASRLRARLAEEPEPLRWTGAPQLAFAGMAFAAAALLAVLLVRAPSHEPAAPIHVAATPHAAEPVHLAAVAPSTAAGSTDAPGRGVRARAHRQARSTPLGFEVLVPPGQLAVALELNAAVNAGHVDGENLLALAQTPTGAIEVKAVEVAPLAPLRGGAPERAETPGDSGRD